MLWRLPLRDISAPPPLLRLRGCWWMALVWECLCSWRQRLGGRDWRTIREQSRSFLLGWPAASHCSFRRNWHSLWGWVRRRWSWLSHSHTGCRSNLQCWFLCNSGSRVVCCEQYWCCLKHFSVMSSNSQIILFVKTRMKREFLAALPGHLTELEQGKSGRILENYQVIIILLTVVWSIKPKQNKRYFCCKQVLPER